ncbi:hypothetical protein L1987_30094 [Smallanthus sonchifolius]|uniref:Uncharacterized protein n=1 Tax=Smallanthus sonchifolius TaxID=185202 RepID=A0ACB9I1R9_9ASTR|nr:hypothetical protein L1987_30094 [Smallanthus sonchifolius]
MKKNKGKLRVTKEEGEEAEKSLPTIPQNVTSYPHTIILGTNMPIGLADEITQSLHEEELKVPKAEENQRKLMVYRSKVASRMQEHKRANDQRIISLGVDKNLKMTVKLKGFIGFKREADRIVCLVPDDLQALIDLPLVNEL